MIDKDWKNKKIVKIKIERSLIQKWPEQMVENQNYQRTQSAAGSDDSPIPVPSEVRRIVSAMPELGLTPEKQLNDVLDLDDRKNVPRSEEQISSQISQNQ